MKLTPSKDGRLRTSIGVTLRLTPEEVAGRLNHCPGRKVRASPEGSERCARGSRAGSSARETTTMATTAQFEEAQAFLLDAADVAKQEVEP